MVRYDDGILSIIDGTMVLIKDGIAETLFTFHDDMAADHVSFTIMTCGTIILQASFGTGLNQDENKYLYCFHKDYPKKIPEGEFPQAMNHYKMSTVFATFYPNLVVFDLSEMTNFEVFGSNIVFINNKMLHLYSFNYSNSNLSGLSIPTTSIVYKNKQSNLPLTKICLIEPITKSIILDDRYAFQQGMCTYIIHNYSVACFHGYCNIGDTLLGLSTKEGKTFELGLINTKGDFKTWDLMEKKERYGEYIKTTPSTLKTYLVKQLPLPLENINIDEDSPKPLHKIEVKMESSDTVYTFNLAGKEIGDYHEVPGGLIVITWNKYKNEDKTTGIEPTYELQGNVLIANYENWICSSTHFGDGILQRTTDTTYYYLSIKNQFRIKSDLFANENMRLFFETIPAGKYVKRQSYCQYPTMSDESDNLDLGCDQNKNFYEIHEIESLNLETHELICKKAFPQAKKSIIKGLNGFYYFDGSKFVGFHEKINMSLRNLSDIELKTLDAELMAQYALDFDFVDILRKKANYRTLNKNVNRKYSPTKNLCDTATVTFIEGEEYLDTILLAKKVNRHHQRLTFELIGSSGHGPRKIVANTIVKDFVNRYFKFDKQFLVPTKFSELDEATKFDLGWILHNILHLTETPIGYRLPLAFLANLIGREPDETELELFAEDMDPAMYDYMNKADEKILEEEGYETRFEWLSMMCRYSKDDMQLYKSFADGFLSFAKNNPIRKANLITADHFISGSKINPSALISYLIDTKKTSHKLRCEKLVEKLTNASESELRIFAFNLTGTYHLSGNEKIEFVESLDQMAYKFSVCFSTLSISKKVKLHAFDQLISELFKSDQANIKN
jgi:hypothetical protein